MRISYWSSDVCSSDLEMLDRVGDVGGGAVDAGVRERLVEDAAGGPDEGTAGQILLIPRLLADEQDARVERPLAEHCLGAAFVEMAAGTALGVLEDGLPGGERVAARLDPTLSRIGGGEASLPLAGQSTQTLSHGRLASLDRKSTRLNSSH